MPYRPIDGTVSNKPYAPATGVPTDARSYYLDSTLFIYRAFQNTTEVLAYLNTPASRTGQFPIFINNGTLNVDGTFSEGTVSEYWFKDGVSDSNLIYKSNILNGLSYDLTTGDITLGGDLTQDTNINTSTFAFGYNVDTVPNNGFLLMIPNSIFVMGYQGPDFSTSSSYILFGGSTTQFNNNGKQTVTLNDTDGLIIYKSDNSQLITFNPSGNITIPQFAGSDPNKFLHVNSDGLLTNVSVTGWSLSGNSGINPTTNFIGTTDNQPLVFKVNSSTLGSLTLNNTINFGWLSLNNPGSGTDNTAFGGSALYAHSTSSYNTCVGSQAGGYITSGDGNTCIGYGSGNSLTTGQFNTFLGYNDLSISYSNTGNHNILLGCNIELPNHAASNQFVIGGNGVKWLVGNNGVITIPNLGGSGVGLVAVDDSGLLSFAAPSPWTQEGPVILANIYGTLSGYVDEGSNTGLGYTIFTNLSSGSGTGNTVIGALSGTGIVNGSNNTILGSNSGSSIISGSNNILIGASTSITGDLSNQLNIGGWIKGDSGSITIPSLAGSGTRTVYVDSNGKLSAS